MISPGKSSDLVSWFTVRNAIILAIVFSLFRLKIFGWRLWDIVLFLGIASWAFQAILASWALHIKPTRPTERLHNRKFRFLRKEVWLSELKLLSIDQSNLDKPAIAESFLISETLEEFVDLIIGEFIDPWFTRVSKNSLFQDSIRVELKGVFQLLKTRLALVNLPNFLAFTLIPIVNTHFTRFVAVTNTHDLNYSVESKLTTARKFVPLHEGVSLVLPGQDREKERMFLRRKVQQMLPLLLSPQETNDTVLVLIREILACTVLANVFDVLSEGDFFNQMIVKLIGDNLQHRDQVKRLRAALQQHTRQGVDTLKFVDSALPDVSGHLSSQELSLWLDHIRSCDSKDKLEQLQIMIQEKQRNVDEQEATDLITLSMALKRRLKSYKEDQVTLESILENPKLSVVFREFLKKDHHEMDLDLWHAIDHIRAPLETSDSSTVPLFLEFSNLDDVRQIYNSFFSNPNLEIDPEIRKCVENYIKSSNDEEKVEVYRSARQALFSLQNEILDHMKEKHFSEFRFSRRYGDLDFTVAIPKQQIRREPSLGFATTTRQSLLANDIDTSSEGISSTVVKAVETAFEQIMMSSTNEHEVMQMVSQETDERTLTVNELAKPNLFREESTLFTDDSKLSSSQLSNSRNSALFGVSSDEESDSESLNSDSMSMEISDSKMTTLEILLAAPGNLSLAEEIAKLTQDIENLSEQEAILSSLLRKAELTNNISELKVLRKSKVSLEREINSKELQKQQYIVQENENSLYGKSKVQIQSYVFDNDSTSQYVLYILEVQKFSSEDPTDITAGWVVARRFSQFYKLHEYLKLRIPQVANIRFPKKTVPVLKFQKKQLVEQRKLALEAYLQELLRIPEVCSDPPFRSFLSSEEFRLGNMKSLVGSKKNFELLINRFYGVSSRVPKAVADKSNMNEQEDKEKLENFKEMQRELKQFDELDRTTSGKIPFVKPIADLLMSIFNLSKSKSWLRGSALLVILQQVLGTTIEKNITQQVENNLRLEERLLDILSDLKSMLFPNGKFRESPEVRTQSQQTATRHESYAILRIFMNETCSKIFGFNNTNLACTNLLEMFQNDYLNKHLLFVVLDELIKEVFPELVHEKI